MADYREARPYNYRQQRRKFAIITYCLTGVFLLFALLQWVAFYLIFDINVFFRLHYWVSIVCFLLSLILIIIFIFFDNLRFIVPLNWLIAILIYETIVLGVTTLIVRHYQFQFIISFLIWVLVLVIFLLIGSFIPHDLTLDIVVLVILGIICIIGAMYFLMLYLVANVPFSFFIHRAFILFSILIFIMYHAQIINGGRFVEIRDHDYLLAALILFFDFLLMYLFTFQLAPKWSDLCDRHLSISNKLVVDNYILPTTTPAYGLLNFLHNLEP